LAELFVKPDREKSIIRRHPWIFSGAVMKLRDAVQIGETVTVVTSRGEFLAKAAYNPHSKIAARV
jgi:23S rRNA (cytosine1962-C5)-methyltransferase